MFLLCFTLSSRVWMMSRSLNRSCVWRFKSWSGRWVTPYCMPFSLSAVSVPNIPRANESTAHENTTSSRAFLWVGALVVYQLKIITETWILKPASLLNHTFDIMTGFDCFIQLHKNKPRTKKATHIPVWRLCNVCRNVSTRVGKKTASKQTWMESISVWKIKKKARLGKCFVRSDIY